jgi:senataxin
VTVEVTTRTYEDDFLDVEMTVQGGVPPDFRPNDTDMVVLRSPGAKPILAKVQGFRRLSALKVRILAMMDQPGLAGRSKWQVYRHVT